MDAVRPPKTSSKARVRDRRPARPHGRRCNAGLNQEFVAEGQRRPSSRRLGCGARSTPTGPNSPKAYRFCLAKYGGRAVGARRQAASAQDHLPALRACAGRSSGRCCATDGRTEGSGTLSAACTWAESQQFAQLNLHVYRGAKGESSHRTRVPARADAGGVLARALLPAQIDIADSIIAQSHSTSVSPRPGTGRPLRIRCPGQRPRAAADQSYAGTSSRCFGPGHTAQRSKRSSRSWSGMKSCRSTSR